jgi:hypothetical protein
MPRHGRQTTVNVRVEEDSLKLKGSCDPLTGDTSRIGAKRQIGWEESLGKCQEASLEYDIKERSNRNGPYHRMFCSCYL